ncbi:MAG: hypothetical protein FJ313_00550 [Gemmatimonadetes bacterium]|nr:hypothetical protein [Gemmatimonadota bacterium]
MSGSPRIWADAWVWARLAQAWAAWRRLAGRRAGPIAIGAAGIGAVAAIVAVAVIAAGGGPPAARALPTPTPGPAYLTEVEALPLAVVALRENGFVGDSFPHIARRVPFRDYAAAIGQAFQAEEGHLELEPQREVWVFAFSGDLLLDLPDGQLPVHFDNLTVVMDALTGDVVRAEAFYGDFESPLRAPVWLRPPTPTPQAE